MASWTKAEDRLLRKYAAMRMYDDEIGELLEKTAGSIKARRQRLGIVKQSPHVAWSDEQAELAIRLKGELTAQQIADRLGCTPGRVHRLFHARGVTEQKRFPPAFKRLLRRRHRQDWCDGEIAREWTAAHPELPADRRAVCDQRTKLGLPSNALGKRRRRRQAEITREQLRRAGLPSIGHLRRKAFADWCAKVGWPQVRRPRLAQILNLLYEHGPHARLAIAQKLDLRTEFRGKQPRSRKLLAGNGPGGSYMAELMRLGLVVRLPGRVVPGRTKYESSFLYAIAPGVRRSLPDEQRPQNADAGRHSGRASA